MITNNKLLISLRLEANALDYQGKAVADGSLSADCLQLLPPLRAEEVYAQINRLVRDLLVEVREIRRQQEIADLESRLVELKNKEVT